MHRKRLGERALTSTSGRGTGQLLCCCVTLVVILSFAVLFTDALVVHIGICYYIVFSVAHVPLLVST